MSQDLGGSAQLADQRSMLTAVRPGTPTSRPLCSLEELLDWKPWQNPSDLFCRPCFPLRHNSKGSPALALDAHHGGDGASDGLWRNSKRLLVCHDMKGGYVEDTWPQGVNCSSIYRIADWPCVDTFVYFSHSLVTIPPPSWTNACHLQGTKVLGTFITEWDKGAEICAEILSSEEKALLCATQLAQIASFYGFDGWLFNIENPVESKNIPLLIKLLSSLTEEMHSLNPTSLVLWYDSVTEEGHLRWQDRLNSLNQCFFNACDGIFTNYSWPEHSAAPRESAGVAGALRAPDVFMGVDVWKVPGRSGKGFDSGEVVGIALKQGVSAALFAPAWVYESGQGPCFQEANSRLWAPIRRAVGLYGESSGDKASEGRDEGKRTSSTGGCRPEVSALPFYSSFDEGVGSGVWVGGCHVARGDWGNMSCQTPLPLLPPLAASLAESGNTGTDSKEACSGETATIPSSAAADEISLSGPRATIIQSLGFEGGGCLSIQDVLQASSESRDRRTGRSNSAESDSSCLAPSPPIHLFAANVPFLGDTTPLHVGYSVLSPLSHRDLLLGLVFQKKGDNPCSYMVILHSTCCGVLPSLDSLGLAQGEDLGPTPGSLSSVEQEVLLPVAHPLDQGHSQDQTLLCSRIIPCSSKESTPPLVSETGLLPVGPAHAAAATAEPESEALQGTWTVREYRVSTKPGFILTGVSALPVAVNQPQSAQSQPTSATSSAGKGVGVSPGPGPVESECLFLGHVRISACSVDDCLRSIPAVSVGLSPLFWDSSKGDQRVTLRIAWMYQGSEWAPLKDVTAADPAVGKGASGTNFTWGVGDSALEKVVGSVEGGSEGLSDRKTEDACTGAFNSFSGPCKGCSFHRFDVWARFSYPTPAEMDNGGRRREVPDGVRGTLQWLGVSFCQAYHVERLKVPCGCDKVTFLVQPRMLCGARLPLERCSITAMIEVPNE